MSPSYFNSLAASGAIYPPGLAGNIDGTPSGAARPPIFSFPQSGRTAKSDADARRLAESLRGQALHVLLLSGPLLALIALTVVFRCIDLDVSIASWFFDRRHATWIGVDSPLCDWAYHLTIPGLLLGIGGVVVAALGSFVPRVRPGRRAGLFFGLMLLLGPGLLVNGVFKPNWLRPRPKQIEAFGGDHKFLHVWDLGDCVSAKSFPCGHASMGFFLMAPAFLLYRRRPGWAALFATSGTAIGCAMGCARMAQGCHFASDVLWSGGMVYVTGLGLLASEEAYRMFATSMNEVGLTSPPEGQSDFDLDEELEPYILPFENEPDAEPWAAWQQRRVA